LLAAFLFIVGVVLTPREAVPAFIVYLGLVAVAARGARVPLRSLVRRLALEVPFLLFVVFMPLVAGGRRVDLVGMSLSIEGLWGAWNVTAKATLSLSATVLLAATTTTADLLHGLEHLRMPRSFTMVAGFMIRYADVIGGEMKRMRIARLARAYSPGAIWQARALGQSAGALFIRSFERGERVHKAMLSRGFNGTMPVATLHAPSLRDWTTALAIPALAASIALVATLIW
jgi:cobalt/nickel transport system permease protein